MNAGPRLLVFYMQQDVEKLKSSGNEPNQLDRPELEGLVVSKIVFSKIDWT